MLIWIPGEIISLVTFPGVIVHEIAHRFFCDIFNVPVYEISYFTLFSETAGHVRHHPIENAWTSFFVGIAPLFVNSALCMILTFPKGTTFLFGTGFFMLESPVSYIMSLFLYWIGLSMGYNAIPSKQDLYGTWYMTNSRISKLFLMSVYGILWPFNVEGAGPIFCLVYAFLLSLALPYLIFS